MEDQVFAQLNKRFDGVDRRFDRMDARMDKIDEAILMLVKSEAQRKGMMRAAVVMSSVIGGGVALIVKFMLEKVV